MPERPVEHQIEAEEVAPEGPRWAEVVVLVGVARSLKRSATWPIEKQRCHEQERHQRPHNGYERDA